MTTIKERINIDLKEAMRAKEKEKVEALRLMTAAIKQVEVDERIDIDDARMITILTKMAKQRNESIQQFSTAGRDDLVAQEQFEINIINQYLPTPLSDDEILKVIEKTLTEVGSSKISDMGKMMATLKPLLQGKADLGKVNTLLKSKLTAD